MNQVSTGVYGGFAWARRVCNSQKLRSPAREVRLPLHIFTTNWFITLFASEWPAEAILPIWDSMVLATANCRTAQGEASSGGLNASACLGYALRARSHCRFVLPLIYFIPYLFLKRQCDRTLRYASPTAKAPNMLANLV